MLSYNERIKCFFIAKKWLAYRIKFLWTKIRGLHTATDKIFSIFQGTISLWLLNNSFIIFIKLSVTLKFESQSADVAYKFAKELESGLKFSKDMPTRPTRLCDKKFYFETRKNQTWPLHIVEHELLLFFIFCLSSDNVDGYRIFGPYRIQHSYLSFLIMFAQKKFNIPYGSNRHSPLYILRFVSCP